MKDGEGREMVFFLSKSRCSIDYIRDGREKATLGGVRRLRRTKVTIGEEKGEIRNGK